MLFDELLPRDPLFTRDRNWLLAELISNLIAGRSLFASREFDKIKGRFYTGSPLRYAIWKRLHILGVSQLRVSRRVDIVRALFTERRTIRKSIRRSCRLTLPTAAVYSNDKIAYLIYA